MRVAIQGERGSFHEVAAKQYFVNIDIDLVPCSSFDLTVESVNNDTADIAVMAIENARSGSILYNYSLLRESGLRIVGEHILKIEQNLMALPGQKIDDIKEIWSHPVAIAQCRSFLNKFPNISIIEKEDTAASARIIRDNKSSGIAAIAAEMAANLYDLQIIERNIETYKKNYTRFLVLSSGLQIGNGLNKASVCFSLGHEPGSLAALLVLLAKKNINLTKIQSVPRMMKDWEYLFYVDLEFNNSSDAEEAITILEENSYDLEILGIYQKKAIL